MSVPDPALTDWVPIYAGSPAFTYRGDYVPATQYNDGDIVMYNGTPWLAVKNNNTPPDPFPLPGGAALTYEGAHVPATEYQDGDVVVKDGVAYICVGGPTTVVPDISVWGPAGLGPIPSYGTSLPASPGDGQEAILVDSMTNPSYQWRFRYNAGSSSPFKWEFIGGAPAYAFSAVGVATGSLSYVDLSPSPSITVPRDGEYDIYFGARMYNDVGGAHTIMTLSFGGVAPNESLHSIAPNIGTVFSMGSRSLRALVAGDKIVKIMYRVNVASTGQWLERDLKVTPARVS